MATLALCVAFIAALGDCSAGHDRGSFLQTVLAERPEDDEGSLYEEGSEDAVADLSHRLEDITKNHRQRHARPQAMHREVVYEVQRPMPVESYEVMRGQRMMGFHPRHDSFEMEQEEHEQQLRRQLELTRQERSEAESLQASEQREAEALRRKLERAAEEEKHTHDLLRAARQELAAKSQEVASSHAALKRYFGFADDLKVAASEAAKAVSRAKREALTAKRSAASWKNKAKQDLAAANVAVERVGAVAKAVSLQRTELLKRESTATAELQRAESARRLYRKQLEQARKAEALAEQQKEATLAEEQRIASAGYLTVQHERWKAAKALSAMKAAEEQKQKHFKAAATMRAETEAAQTLVEEARREKAAARKERARAIWLEKTVHRERQSMSTLARVSWVLLAGVLIGVIGFVSDVHSLEAFMLSKLLGPLQGCVKSRRQPPKLIDEPEVCPKMGDGQHGDSDCETQCESETDSDTESTAMSQAPPTHEGAETLLEQEMNNEAAHKAEDFQ